MTFKFRVKLKGNPENLPVFLEGEDPGVISMQIVTFKESGAGENMLLVSLNNYRRQLLEEHIEVDFEEVAFNNEDDEESTTPKQWVQFWKSSGTEKHETYLQFPENWTQNEELMDGEVLDWAENTWPYVNVRFYYGWEPVEKPPRGWIEEQHEYHRTSISNHMQEMQKTSRLLETYENKD